MLETQFEGTPKRMVYTLDAIDEAAAFVLRESSHKVLLFSGDMGAGKNHPNRLNLKAIREYRSGVESYFLNRK